MDPRDKPEDDNLGYFWNETELNKKPRWPLKDSAAIVSDDQAFGNLLQSFVLSRSS